MIAFSVECLPVAQPRQRHRVVTTKGGKTFATNFTPRDDPVNFFKSEIKRAFEDWRKIIAPDFKVLEGPISLYLAFYFPRPAYMLKNKFRQDVDLPKTTVSDLDNLEKSFCDALKSLAWRDDAQICRKVTSKDWCSSIRKPGVVVKITEI